MKKFKLKNITKILFEQQNDLNNLTQSMISLEKEVHKIVLNLAETQDNANYIGGRVNAICLDIDNNLALKVKANELKINHLIKLKEDSKLLAETWNSFGLSIEESKRVIEILSKKSKKKSEAEKFETIEDWEKLYPKSFLKFINFSRIVYGINLWENHLAKILDFFDKNTKYGFNTIINPQLVFCSSFWNEEKYVNTKDIPTRKEAFLSGLQQLLTIYERTL